MIAPNALAPTADHGIETLFVEGPPRLALDHRGDRSNPPVLFLHGIGGNRTNWH